MARRLPLNRPPRPPRLQRLQQLQQLQRPSPLRVGLAKPVAPTGAPTDAPPVSQKQLETYKNNKKKFRLEKHHEFKANPWKHILSHWGYTQEIMCYYLDVKDQVDQKVGTTPINMKAADKAKCVQLTQL